MKKLRYAFYETVLMEVPNEVSLSFSLTECPNKCKGCHWEHLNKPGEGEELTEELFTSILENQYPAYTCVLFFGGEWNTKYLMKLMNIVKDKYPSINLALYTGNEFKDLDKNLIDILDYVKVGRFIEELGPLNKRGTNQVLYKLPEKKSLNYIFYDRL